MGLGGLAESRRSSCGMKEWGGILVVEAVFRNTRFLTTVATGILLSLWSSLAYELGF